MGKAKRFNNYDSDVEQQRKLVKSYGLARQNNSASSFRSIPQSPPTATNTDNEAVVVTSSTVANNSITFAKIQDIATMKVIGRTATGTGDSSEISILDEDDMASDSAVALATQQSIKAYVTSNAIAKPIASALDLNGNQLQGIETAFFDGDTDNAHSIQGNSGGLDYNVDNTDETHDFKINGVTKFNVTNSQVNLFTHLTMSGNSIYLDSDLDTSINSYSDDSLQMSVGGNIRLTISNTSTIVTNAFSVLGSTTLGDSAGDLINIPGLVNFTGNYSAVAQTAGNSTGYITILINGSAKKLYYY